MQNAERGMQNLQHSALYTPNSAFEWASCRCCPVSTCLQRKPADCRKEAKWSQSPVLPWTQRAYETCLSAGSTAFELWKWSSHPELHQAGLLTEQAHRSKCF